MSESVDWDKVYEEAQMSRYFGSKPMDEAVPNLPEGFHWVVKKHKWPLSWFNTYSIRLVNMADIVVGRDNALAERHITYTMLKILERLAESGSRVETTEEKIANKPNVTWLG